MALVLLIASGLLLRSFSNLRDVDPGYETSDIFTFQMAPDRPALNDGPTYARFHLDFMRRLRELPGVKSVGLVENVPLNEGTNALRWISDESGAEGGSILNVTFEAGDYFQAMGIKVIAGRPLSEEETLNWRGNVVVSKAAASLMWPGKDPLGHRMHAEGDTTWVTVVGVGVILGVVVALLSTKALASLLFGISALDAGTFVAMSTVLVAVGMLASYLPVRRASRVDPIESLREG